MSEPKLCIDCKYFKSNRLCYHPSNGNDYVEGGIKSESCSILRLEHRSCKPEGLLFEPMEPVIYDIRDIFPAPQFPNIRGETQ